MRGYSDWRQPREGDYSKFTSSDLRAPGRSHFHLAASVGSPWRRWHTAYLPRIETQRTYVREGKISVILTLIFFFTWNAELLREGADQSFPRRYPAAVIRTPGKWGEAKRAASLSPSSWLRVETWGGRTSSVGWFSIISPSSRSAQHTFRALFERPYSTCFINSRIRTIKAIDVFKARWRSISKKRKVGS